MFTEIVSIFHAVIHCGIEVALVRITTIIVAGFARDVKFFVEEALHAVERQEVVIVRVPMYLMTIDLYVEGEVVHHHGIVLKSEATQMLLHDL